MKYTRGLQGLQAGEGVRMEVLKHGVERNDDICTVILQQLRIHLLR